MATTLSYSVSDFVPFTKIVSADVNTRFTDIKNRLNWAGGTSATTGLGDDNIQSTTASGGGLTRATKLKAGTANYVLINDSNGAMSEEAQLNLTRGGTGASLSLAGASADDVVKVNSGVTGLTIGPPTVTPSVRIYSHFRFI